MEKKLHGFKNCFSRVHKIFLRKKCFDKKYLHDFFGLSAESFSKFRKVFSGLCQNAIKASSRALRGKPEVWDNFWQSFTKILSMSVFFAFYVPRGNFWGRKCLNKLFFSHFFFEQETFQIFGKVFFGKAAKHAI